MKQLEPCISYMPMNNLHDLCQHAGIIVCKKRPDWDWAAYAGAIDSVLSQLESLNRELVRMNQRYSDESS